jgi:5-bromo-4-chloroindolyl phosphate hydrolysis protein
LNQGEQVSIVDMSRSIRRDSSQIEGEDINGTVENLEIQKNLENLEKVGDNSQEIEQNLDETDFFVSFSISSIFRLTLLE